VRHGRLLVRSVVTTEALHYLEEAEPCSAFKYGTLFRFARGDLVGVTKGEAQGTYKRVRPDAQRSLDALVKAAKEVFATSGVDAPVREIADKAGVGIGTLYRHFPQRSDLVTAVFRSEIEACAVAGAELAAQYPPGEALERWIERFLGFIATKRGLVAALHSGNPAFEPLPAYFDGRLWPVLGGLLDSAVAAGEIRAGVDARELLNAVASLASRGGPDAAKPMIRLLLDGLRYGVTPAGSVSPRSADGPKPRG
jgi:AcrR family transcriptional regulator